MSQYLYYCVGRRRQKFIFDGQMDKVVQKKRDLVEFKAISGDNHRKIRIRAFTKRGYGSNQK